MKKTDLEVKHLDYHHCTQKLYTISDSITANVALICFYKLLSIPHEGENFSALLLPQVKLEFISPARCQAKFLTFAKFLT